MKKGLRNNYDGICQEYTSSQLDFYKKYPDVTRILIYYLFTKISDWLILQKPGQKEFTLLDPCCGFGKDINFFQTYLKNNYLNINSNVLSGDSSQGMLRIAKDKFGAKNLLHRPYEDTGLHDKSVDLVTTRYGLDYSLNPNQLYAELYRILKSYGYVIGTINHQYLMDQLPVVSHQNGIGLLKLPVFSEKVELIKPRLGNKSLEALTQEGFEIIFKYGGIEHPYKFPVINKIKGTKEYTIFVAKKNTAKISPPLKQGPELNLLIRGILRLEHKFRTEPDSDYSRFVSFKDILSLEEFNRILQNIIAEGITDE